MPAGVTAAQTARETVNVPLAGRWADPVAEPGPEVCAGITSLSQGLSESESRADRTVTGRVPGSSLPSRANSPTLSY